MADFQSELVARGMPLNASQLSFAFVRFDTIPMSSLPVGCSIRSVCCRGRVSALSAAVGVYRGLIGNDAAARTLLPQTRLP